jgi:hypothetical protein
MDGMMDLNEGDTKGYSDSFYTKYPYLKKML